MPRPPPRVALETTLLVHGVPHAAAGPLLADLESIVRAGGAEPALVGLYEGSPVAAMTAEQFTRLLSAPDPPKINAANLAPSIAARISGATTISATAQIAASAGIRVFATGGLGGLHRDLATRLDVSADLAALARTPIVLVCSGVKSILDVAGTRELLEALGVPVLGFGVDVFPSFYLRTVSPAIPVDARFDDAAALARCVRHHLASSGRAAVVVNPIPREHELDPRRLDEWIGLATARALDAGAVGRAVTPATLAALHEVSGGATLRANLELVKSNAALAASLAVAMMW